MKIKPNMPLIVNALFFLLLGYGIVKVVLWEKWS
jgi:hypothetical protein